MEGYTVPGLPTTWFLTPEGKKISYYPGYMDTEQFMMFLKYVRGNYYSKMSLKEFIDLENR